MMGIKEQIEAWFAAGANDFDVGMVLLKQVNKNVYYLRNIERSRRLKTLVYELGKHKGKSVKAKGESEIITTHTLPRIEPPRPTATSRQIGTGSPKEGNGGEFKEVKSFVLREQFPILNSKDCPAHIKIAVADMITAHTNYKKAHERLFDVVNKGDAACYDVANDVMTNYLENKRIWGELENYHPVRQLTDTPPERIGGEINRQEGVGSEEKAKGESKKVKGEPPRPDGHPSLEEEGGEIRDNKLNEKIKYRKRLLAKETDKKKREKILDELIKLTAIRDGKA